MKTANAAKLSAAPVSLIVKIDGRTRIGRAVKNVAAANDITPVTLDARYVAPALPEVRQVTAVLAPPCDARIIVDVIRAGWCSTAKTLTYGLCRAGIAPARIQSVILAAMKSGLIASVRGVWCLSGLVA